MPALRFYYSDTIEDFLRKPINEIVGNLALAHAHDINQKTSMSWMEEIDILKSALANFSGRGDCSTLNVPLISLSNVPGISE